MAVNIFELFGTIGADDKPAKKAIDNVVSHAKNANHVMSDGLNKIGSTATSMGNTLNKYITKPAMIATTALAGISLKKGWDRLTGIDDARAKLMGLGHDAKAIEKIMNSALESVKGTSFGMDEAATTAANAVAAGVKEGEELTKYLKLTADAAAIAGTSMGEMGSIINKVQTGGRAMTENLEQLSDRGLPIYQWLAKEAGVAADAVKDMASDGEISSEMFLAAIEKNIGGAAAIMGENSFKSTIANIGASLGRVGANFLDAGGKGGGFFSTMKPLLADMNNNMGVLEDKAADIGVKFGESFNKVIKVVSDLKAKFDELSPAAQSSLLKSAAGFAGFAIAAGPALKIFGKFSSGLGSAMAVAESFNGVIGGLVSTFTGGMGTMGSGLVSFGGLLLQIIGPTAIIGTLIVGLGAVQSAFGDQINFLIQTAITKGPEIVTSLGEGMAQAIPELMNKGTELITGLIDVVVVNLPFVLEQGVSIVSALIEGVGTNLPRLIESGLELVTSLITGIISYLPVLVTTGLDLILSLINGIVQNIPMLQQASGDIIWQLANFLQTDLPQIIQKGTEVLLALIEGIVQILPELIPIALQLITTLVEGIVTNLPVILNSGMQILMALITGILEVIPELVPTILQVITTIVTLVTENLPQLIETGIQILMSLITGIVETLPQLIPTAIEAILTIVGALIDSLPQIIDAGIQILLSLISGIIQVLPELIPAVVKAIGTILGAIANALPQIISAGIEIIITLASGLLKGIPELLKAIPQIAKAIIDGLSEINLIDIGRAIIDGFIDGLMGAWERGKDFVGGIGDWIRDNKGPIEVDRVLLTPAGNAIMDGLKGGLVDGFKDVQSYVSSVADTLSADFDPGVFQTDLNYAVNGQGVQTTTGQSQLELTLARLLALLEDWKENPIELNIYNEGDVEWLRNYIEKENGFIEATYKFKDKR